MACNDVENSWVSVANKIDDGKRRELQRYGLQSIPVEYQSCFELIDYDNSENGVFR